MSNQDSALSTLEGAIGARKWLLAWGLVELRSTEEIQAELISLPLKFRLLLLASFALQSPEYVKKWAPILRKKNILLDDSDTEERAFPLSGYFSDNEERSGLIYQNLVVLLQFALRFQHEAVLSIYYKMLCYNEAQQIELLKAENRIASHKVEGVGFLHLLKGRELIHFIAHAFEDDDQELFVSLRDQCYSMRESTGAWKYYCLCDTIRKFEGKKKNYGDGEGRYSYILTQLGHVKKEFEREGRLEHEDSELAKLVPELEKEYSQTTDTGFVAEDFAQLQELITQLQAQRKPTPPPRCISLFSIQSRLEFLPGEEGVPWWNKLRKMAGNESLILQVKNAMQDIQRLGNTDRVLMFLVERRGYCLIQDGNLFPYINLCTVSDLLEESVRSSNEGFLDRLEKISSHCHFIDNSMQQYYLLAKIICQLKIQGLPYSESLMTELLSILREKSIDAKKYQEAKNTSSESGREYNHIRFPLERLKAQLVGLEQQDKLAWDNAVACAKVSEEELMGDETLTSIPLRTT